MVVILVLFLLTACQTAGTGRADEGGMTVPTGRVGVPGAAIGGQVACAAGCAPRVELLDAVSLREVAVDADGSYRIPAGRGGRYLALSAPGHLPQLLRLEAGEAPAAVILEPATDPRQSYLFGVVVHALAGGKGGAHSTLNPVAGKALILTRGRARQEIGSDARGEFRQALHAGHYDLIVDGRRQPLELPPQGSLFLPVVVGTTLVD